MIRNSCRSGEGWAFRGSSQGESWGWFGCSHRKGVNDGTDSAEDPEMGILWSWEFWWLLLSKGWSFQVWPLWFNYWLSNLLVISLNHRAPTRAPAAELCLSNRTFPANGHQPGLSLTSAVSWRESGTARCPQAGFGSKDGINKSD